MNTRLKVVIAAVAFAAAATHARASEPGDLTALTLEELAQIQVTSVARAPQSLSDAAAAVFVITRDDIRRSGAPNLPEVLRLAPNLQVQQVDANNYAISARGFNSFEAANKLLVLVDGRSIYSTLFSGVLWDAHSLLLEDIERIEVISGPGGALYGANAVNGVINIITRTAHDTTGPAVSVGVGSEDAVLSMRIGGRAGDAAWRAYVRGFERAESDLLGGGGAGDDSHGVRGGFRADGALAGGDTWTLQAEAFSHQGPAEAEMTGGHVSGEWRRTLSSGEIRALAYVDASRRLNADADERIRAFNLDVQHS
ncbi:MAG: TonB-dependent receptor plug domain-containing protein, partial [Brevundimonas sp.]